MRVLLVTDWPAAEGGVETYVEQVAAGLRGRGHAVWVLASDAGRGRDVADVVVRAPRRAVDRAVLQVASPFALAAARRAVAAFRPDAALVTMFEMCLSPSVVIGLGAVPYLLNVAYYKPICPTGLKLLPDGRICDVRAGRACRASGCVPLGDGAREWLRYRRIRAVLERAAAVVTCSEWMRGVLAQDGVVAASSPWPVRPAGGAFRRRPAPEPVVAVAGRLAREKGVDDLLRAVARIAAQGHPLRACVLGDGPERARLEALARELGIAGRVDWRGHVAPDELDAALAAAWALVAPSRWAEPLGLGVIEAIVRGVPVVASAHGGHRETVEEGVTGLLYRNGDVAALAACLARVVDGSAFPGARLPVGATARLADRHALDRHLDWLEEGLRRAAGAARHAR